MNVYTIRDWNRYFENNRSRDFKKLSWVPMPNKHDGDSYRELVDHPNGAAHYGAWCACVGVASKSQPRGSLLRDGCVPHDAMSLSRKTGIRSDVFLEALPRFVKVGWMDVSHSESTIPQDAAEIPQATAAVSTLNGIELNGTEQNRHEQKEQKPQAAKRNPELSFGELQSVKLTSEEYAKLQSKHKASRLNCAFEIADTWLAKGGKAKNHYALLKSDSWVWDRVTEKMGQESFI